MQAIYFEVFKKQPMNNQDKKQREIKFRAWSTATRSWVSDGVLDMNGHLCDIGSSGDLYAKPSHIVVMQWTGLKDKNGVEIYEGDILGGLIGGGIVVWHNSWCGFRIQVAGEIGEIEFHEVDPSELDIVGNIHQNPELLTNNQ